MWPSSSPPQDPPTSSLLIRSKFPLALVWSSVHTLRGTGGLALWGLVWCGRADHPDSLRVPPRYSRYSRYSRTHGCMPDGAHIHTQTRRWGPAQSGLPQRQTLHMCMPVSHIIRLLTYSMPEAEWILPDCELIGNCVFAPSRLLWSVGVGGTSNLHSGTAIRLTHSYQLSPITACRQCVCVCEL